MIPGQAYNVVTRPILRGAALLIRCRAAQAPGRDARPGRAQSRRIGVSVSR
jgi:hypothetical protein